jgi:hypothetical protein
VNPPGSLLTPSLWVGGPQALKDARTALAWSKTKGNPSGWARAHWLMALALERLAHLPDFSKTEIAALGEGGRKYALHVATTTAAVLCARRAFEAHPEQVRHTTPCANTASPSR